MERTDGDAVGKGSYEEMSFRGAWLTQSVEHVTLDLRVMSLSPSLGEEITLRKKERKNSVLDL